MLSYLPLSHIAEQMFTVHGAAAKGYAVYFSRGLDFLADDLHDVHPTMFFGVPRVWEKLQAAISEKSGQAMAVQRALFAWAQKAGRRWEAAHARGEAPSMALRMQYGLAKRLVHRKIQAALGMDATRAFMTGAAPTKKGTHMFFAGLGMPLFDVYGLSESTGVATFNSAEAYRLGTAGRPLPEIDVQTREDGEVVIRGRNVFQGYYKDDEETAERLRDGWLHTGDLGSFDEDGFLRITGRAKDIIVTSGGKNITPQPIESGIQANELVAEAVLIGDQRNYLTALVTLDPDAAKAFAEQEGIDEPLQDSAKVREHIQETVDKVNEQFARVEQVKRFAILPEPLSMEAGELTPTLKVRRQTVVERNAEVIEAMYAQERETAKAS
jgi:long-chain acyl-CoA synthetase